MSVAVRAKAREIPSYVVAGSSISVPINGKDILARALRVVRDYCPLAYGKLVAMDWFGTDRTAYGATDGRKLLLNPKGLAKLAETSDPVGLTAFLLLHEAYHALLGHGHRLKGLNHDLANRAADYSINWLISQENNKYDREHFPIIEGALLDPRFDNMSTIEIYRQLLKEQPEPPQGDNPEGDGDGVRINPAPNPEGDSEDGEGDGDTEGDSTEGEDTGSGDTEGDEDGDGTEGGDTEGDDGEDTGGDDSTSGGGADTNPGQPGSDSDILGDDFVGKGGQDTFEPKANPKEKKSQEEVEKEIDQHNEKVVLIDRMSESCGIGGSAGTRSVAEQNSVTKKPFDWASYLINWMSARLDEGWNKMFNTPMYSSTGMVCAGRERKSAGKLVIVVDDSGSIYDRLLKLFLLCVQEVLDEMKPEVIHLIAVDNHYPTEDRQWELRPGDTVPESLPNGGGGTAFQPAFDWVEDNCPDCDGLVYITDGQSWDISDIREPDYPVFWLSWWLNKDSFPFGDAHRIDPSIASYDHGQ